MLLRHCAYKYALLDFLLFSFQVSKKMNVFCFLVSAESFLFCLASPDALEVILFACSLTYWVMVSITDVTLVSDDT